MGDGDQPAALDRVGDRTADDWEDEDGDERGEAQQPDCEVRSGDLEYLERDRDRDDLVAEVRDAVPEEEQPEVARDPERRQVHQMAPRAFQDADTRRRIGAREHGDLVHGRGP